MFRLRKLGCITQIINCGSVRWKSTTKRNFKEVSIPVPWGHIAGKWWEPYDTRPILSVHGWQDNCQTFDRLIPLLNRDVGFLAIDLPGHGYSSRLSAGMLYHHTNFLLTIRSIAKTFNWPTTSFMGHSLGSIICYVYAMLYPTEIDFLMCIDAMKPMITSKKHTHIAKALDQFFTLNDYAMSSKEPPSYTLEEMKKMVAAPNDNSILPEYTTYIIERNAAPSKVNPGKYYFSRDPRVKTGALFSYCQDELVKLAEHMTMPMFIVKSRESEYFENEENFFEVLNVIRKVSSDCDFHFVEGRHHLHLNNPENISELMNVFLRRNSIHNRNIGGITDDIVREATFEKIF